MAETLATSGAETQIKTAVREAPPPCQSGWGTHQQTFCEAAPVLREHIHIDQLLQII